MMKKLMNLFKREEGQGMVEYAMIIGLVAIGLVLVLGALTGQLQAVFQSIVDTLAAAVGP